jgi:hypothetical protein
MTPSDHLGKSTKNHKREREREWRKGGGRNEKFSLIFWEINAQQDENLYLSLFFRVKLMSFCMNCCVLLLCSFWVFINMRIKMNFKLFVTLFLYMLDLIFN